MDSYPDTKFISHEETEANRIIHTAVQTANGFYFTHNFAVLPYLDPGKPNVVFLPNIEYEKIPDFFNNLKEIHTIIPLNYPPQLVNQVKKIVTYKEIEYKQIKKFETNWRNIEQAFWSFLNEIMPNHIKNIKDVEVRITQYGTKMSYEEVSPTKKRTLTCYIRLDMNVANIGEAIIQALLLANEDYLIMNWEERESIADFLIQRLVDKGIFKEYRPTIAPLKNPDEQQRKESILYLAKLGLIFEKPYQKENNLIYLNNKVISAKLTAIQHLILSLLIDKQNQVVTYDDLGNIIWTQEEDFSIWAINKNIQRLRTKLISLGAPKNSLQPIKGKGYSLLNN